jgi:type II secretory pathway pseudopilin PulG
MKVFRRRGPGRARGGMVLLEAIIAMAVFATVVVGLVLALDASLDAAKARNEADAAIRGLENQMELLHAGRVNPVDKDLDDDGSGLTYHLTIEPEQMQDQKNQPVAGMYRATVTVKWGSGKDSNERSLSELIYQP